MGVSLEFFNLRAAQIASNLMNLLNESAPCLASCHPTEERFKKHHVEIMNLS